MPRSAKTLASNGMLSDEAPAHDWAGLAVVGIGASAGGLDACRKFLAALPEATGMSFILVLHLDPNNESMMAELLAGHAAIPVLQAVHGMSLQPNHLYVIPPATYLAVHDGAFSLSVPVVRHGARLPVDFMLRSLAAELGSRAAAMILSGTGEDGALGVRALHESGGLVIAQDPGEAQHAGMPRSAILTGVVDHVLEAGKMYECLAQWRLAIDRLAAAPLPHTLASPAGDAGDPLDSVIALVRSRTPLDFAPYKRGTLQRRIERRMSLAGIAEGDTQAYVALLQGDEEELSHLTSDLLINVTSFFRDPKVFALLEDTIIPEMVQRHAGGQPIRVWVVGCSSGEEAYSLVMLFREAIAAAKLHIKLQVFASDLDPDSIAAARAGQYPTSIEADVSPSRLAKFFSRENGHYVVSPDLRASIVFTVQDILADAPFSRLDLVSCRNLLIYLRPDAQAKVISLLHFALAEQGILLLGNSESIGNAQDRFEVVAKSERLYRRVGRSRPGELGLLIGDDSKGSRLALGRVKKPSRQRELADICGKMLIESFAPMAILSNRKHECLYTHGNVDRYLSMPPGPPTQDLLLLARPVLRSKLRSAIHRALLDNKHVVVPGGRIDTIAFDVDVRPFAADGEELLLICLIERPADEAARGEAVTKQDAPRVLQLEQELDATRAELQGAISNLEFANEEQKAVNEEALSIQEEYQSTNEELLTSKEELQSLNEELSALNSQLHETLERQRTTSNDLQNVLYSTNVATIFLDTELNIRFFTPATKALFNILPSDVGRRLADLNFLAADAALLTDASLVMQTAVPIAREIPSGHDTWYTRRILPYRAQDNTIEGVVITFVDVTERRRISEALEAAIRQADLANVAKSRFLAAASHDLRQPLQTLTLLQSLMMDSAGKEEQRRMLLRFDETLVSMSDMLNTLLDINQIEAGTIKPSTVDFKIADLLARLGDQFEYHAQAKHLTFTVMPCSLSVHSDPHLLEQIIRNLLSNALKYTREGRVLLGCRRRGRHLRIEIWDTGIGIPDSEIRAIFDEYHQVDNPARERALGLGLGLSIVRRLGTLLDHPITVRSRSGFGSVFAVEVPVAAPVAAPAAQPPAEMPQTHQKAVTMSVPCNSGAIVLSVEDDHDISDLLCQLLRDLGYHVAAAPHADAAMALITEQKLRPDIILADYNLPGGVNGVQMVGNLRQVLQTLTPAVILTGDISTRMISEVSAAQCNLLHKPIRFNELSKLIASLMTDADGARESVKAAPPAPAAPTMAAPATDGPTGQPVIFVVDDDRDVRNMLRLTLEADGRKVETFDSGEAFLAAYQPGTPGCLLLDAYMPGLSGMELLLRMQKEPYTLPTIMITGSSDVATAVASMKAGAVDFIEKPVGATALLASIADALEHARDGGRKAAQREAARIHFAGLTQRQREVMDMVLAGHPSKNIAADLGISQRTVENHRASIMRRSGVKSLPALARLAMAAGL